MTRIAAAVLAALPLLIAPLAAPTAIAQAAEFLPYEDHVAPDGMTGDDLYRHMLENRFDTFSQTLKMRSGDQSGNFQEVELRLRYKSYRAKKGQILSKTIAKYFSPTDVRHLGYLIINKRSGPDDQFIYRPSSRKVRRVNVRGEAIAGTDFAFEDVVPQEFEDGQHFRLPDVEIEGALHYAVAVVPRPETESEYSKFVLQLEKTHFVPIRTLYWDNKQTLIKQLDAKPGSIERYAESDDGSGKPRDIWISTESRMRHLQLSTFTELVIESLEPAPDLKDRHFSERELTRSN